MTVVQMSCPSKHYHILEIILVVTNVSFHIRELALFKVLKSSVMICMLLVIGIIII